MKKCEDSFATERNIMFHVQGGAMTRRGLTHCSLKALRLMDLFTDSQAYTITQEIGRAMKNDDLERADEFVTKLCERANEGVTREEMATALKEATERDMEDETYRTSYIKAGIGALTVEELGMRVDHCKE